MAPVCIGLEEAGQQERLAVAHLEQMVGLVAVAEVLHTIRLMEPGEALL